MPRAERKAPFSFRLDPQLVADVDALAAALGRDRTYAVTAGLKAFLADPHGIAALEQTGEPVPPESRAHLDRLNTTLRQRAHPTPPT